MEDEDVSELGYMDRAAESTLEQHKKVLEEFERKREARGIIVPVDDVQVRKELRKRQVPVTLFGEDAYDRRERLRLILALELEKADKESDEAQITAAGATLGDEKQTEIFYTEGTARLKAARKEICLYSLRCARERISQEKRRIRAMKALSEQRNDVDEEDFSLANSWQQKRKEFIKSAQFMSVLSSQFGDERPLTGIRFAPNDQILATCSWSGIIRLWDVSDCNQVGVLQGHSERVSSVAFSSNVSSGYLLASASADNTVRLWSVDCDTYALTKTSIMRGHSERVTSVEFHPLGKYLASSSFDRTWRLWDAETRKQLLVQEGHSKPLYKVSFQTDGSLAISAGADCGARVWDLRTGRSIASFLGHGKPILTVDGSPDGYHFATGSEDHSIRIWDIRKKRCVYTIPAHSALVSHVEFHKNGHFLLSSSFDNSCKLWSTQGWVLIKALVDHEDKVMCCNSSGDGQYIASCCFDRTWKLWGVENGMEEKEQEKVAQRKE
ncbi:hypothetical protein GpartN1_g1451.t1 [Galdieria partita]|uniref:Pre-mRNA processing factor 4 (PRP4)-like domain-containing protein n=1 Tax=Galdieria partita TaxID=83374 RepID=A0A9C7PSF4_9RHOD|nr:hypothetical protein GpartN1_g1451.t1 [Galdieria partita]